MRWTERQHTILQAMGLRLWAPPAAQMPHPLPAPPAAQPTPAPAATVARVPAPVAVPVAGSVATPAAAPPTPAAQPAAATPASTPTRRLPPPTAAPTPVPLALPVGHSQREQRIATMGWDALRDSVAQCQDCGLCQSRKHTVFGMGHPQAHWMLVGEAPGEQEDLQGQPFVGPAGQLLDQMLAALSLSRDPNDPAERQIYIANTLKCRPPRNRDPSPEELGRCRPYLQRQIALVQPRVLLAAGRYAVQALLGINDQALGRLRGRVHQYQGIPVVVTYHPAYLLRQPTEKAKSWEDLCLADALMHRIASSPAAPT